MDIEWINHHHRGVLLTVDSMISTVNVSCFEFFCKFFCYSKFISAREMREESERIFTFFWIIFGLMVFAAILMSLKKMCDAADKERVRRRLQSSCGNWSHPVYPTAGRSHGSSVLVSSPYQPTVIDASNHSCIPERIHVASSAPKDHGSVLIDLPPAYDDVVRNSNAHSSEDNHSADHSSSNHCTDHTSSDAGCSGDIGSSSTND